MAQRVLTCPGCGAPIEVPDHYFKAAIACGQCGKLVSRLSGQAYVPVAQEQTPQAFAAPVHPVVPHGPGAAQYPGWQPQAPQAAPYPNPYPWGQPAPGYPVPGQTPAYMPPARRGMSTALKVVLIVGGTVLLFTVLAVLAAIGIAGRGVANEDVAEWDEYKAHDNSYAVRLPAEPKRETRTVTNNGISMTLHFMVAERRGREFGAYHFDLPDAPSAEAFDFEDAIAAAATGMKGTTTSHGPVKVAGRDGHGGEIAHPNGRKTKIHMLVAGQRVVALQASNYKAEEAPVVDAFMASLRLEGELATVHDPWLPYRRVGNTWTKQTNIGDGKESKPSMSYTVTVKEAHAKHAVIETELIMANAVPGYQQMEPTVSTVEFQALAQSMQNAPRPTSERDETIQVPAGTFHCSRREYSRGNHTTVTWIDKRTGLPVKTTSGQSDSPHGDFCGIGEAVSEMVELKLNN